MLEIAFGESVAGALKYAIGRKKGQIIAQGAVSVFCDDSAERARILAEMQRPRQWQGGEIPGRGSDVACLNLYLDYGDLTRPDDRAEALRALFGRYEGVVGDMCKTTQQALARIDEADEIRLWVGEQDACDLTGAFYICHRLRASKARIYMVYVPMLVQKDNAIVRHSGAADMEPEELSLYAEKSVELSTEMRSYMANRFAQMQQENAPLRAMVNGIVASVPENIYDPILEMCMPEGEFVLGKWLGRALSLTRGVGDAFLYLRILKMLEDGKAVLTEPAREDNPYSAVLRRK